MNSRIPPKIDVLLKKCNKQCANCGGNVDNTVDLTNGVFICDKCSIIHRRLSFNVKLLGVDDLSASEEQILIEKQNNGSQSIDSKCFLQQNVRIAYDCNENDRVQYIMNKYRTSTNNHSNFQSAPMSPNEMTCCRFSRQEKKQKKRSRQHHFFSRTDDEKSKRKRKVSSKEDSGNEKMVRSRYQSYEMGMVQKENDVEIEDQLDEENEAEIEDELLDEFHSNNDIMVEEMEDVPNPQYHITDIMGEMESSQAQQTNEFGFGEPFGDSNYNHQFQDGSNISQNNPQDYDQNYPY